MSLEKFINGILLIYFPLMVIKAPLLDLYMFLPATSSNGNLLKMRGYNNHTQQFKPHFYVDILWLDLLIKWPICIFNFYGLFTNKYWVRMTCLMYGVFRSRSWYVLLNYVNIQDCNLFRYGYVLKTFYAYESLYTFMVFGLITTLIGLIPISSPIDHVRKKTSDGAKNRA
ncbi:hypothetical protein MKW92_053445 [Papaver armeniacum]|nr:hypothetical protein MKW92_053445 [Papaver armeniacum]